MSINRVPSIPFAQIANSALRDPRLSFKARGILAMVLSNVGEWEATADWIEKQSNHDGTHAVQSALNELTKHGYRVVRKERKENGQIYTVTDWYHESELNRSPEKPTVGYSDLRGSAPSLEDYLLEDHCSEYASRTPVRKPIQSDLSFDQFWSVYPRKQAKGHAKRAWTQAIRKCPAPVIIAGAARYRDDPNREKEFTAMAATWLNAERWEDEPLPQRTGKTDAAADMIRRAAEREMLEIE